MNKRNLIIILANIGIILVCLTMITATYAYFTVKVDGNSDPIEISTFNKKMKINYVDTSNVSLVNAYTGDSITKTFSITNTGETLVYYDIVLEKVVNNFIKTDDLVYTLYGDNNGAIVKETVMPKTDYTLASNIKIDVNETQNYTMIILFLKTNKDQSDNMNKTFSSNINVVASNSVNSGKSIYDSNTIGNAIVSNNIGSEKDIDFNTNPVDGIYYTNSSINGSTVYFYRGSSQLNNNVIFANYCWKIVRTTEDNGVRLIYNGIPSEDNKCLNTSQILEEKIEYNTKSNYNAYVGYMYGNASSNNYENEHVNINQSNIKEYLDNWYKENLTNYETNISNNAIYCNNRKNIEFTFKGVLYGNAGYGNNNSGYLLMNDYYSNHVSLNCNNISDRLTVNNNNGRKVLNKSIGLITAEELYYAGYINKINKKVVDNKNNYLFTNDTYWTMTPAYFNGSNAYNFVVSKGKLVQNNVTNLNGVRPVITVNGNSKILSGVGSLDIPYILNN